MPVEGRGLSSRQTQDAGRTRRLGDLATPKSAQKLQTALHAKGDLPPEKWTPGYADFASARSGVM